VEAQYRDFLESGKGKSQKTFQALTFQAKDPLRPVFCLFNEQKWARGPFLSLTVITDVRR
ncbi:hypothetical protein WB91_15630, partial [bacteria symbiont BFo1 of Frankliniella occidentalis]